MTRRRNNGGGEGGWEPPVSTLDWAFQPLGSADPKEWLGFVDEVDGVQSSE